jgi:hypothetical protein
MNTTSDITDTNSALQLVWPLPATKLAHAHLTWDEWVTQMAEDFSDVSLASAQTATREPDSIRYLVQYATATVPSWPLPATKLPSFRISWAEWVAMLTGASSSSPSQRPENPASAA